MGEIIMSSVFNTSFETGLRIILILNYVYPNSYSIEKLTAYDFITLYGSDFGTSADNLHNDNLFRYSELASKRENIKKSLKMFVAEGYVTVKSNVSGFSYIISKLGQDFCDEINNNYANNYLSNLVNVVQMFSELPDRKLLQLIFDKALAVEKERYIR